MRKTDQPEAFTDEVQAYESVRQWYAGLKKRLDDVCSTAGVSSGYAVPSRLREAFEILPPSHQQAPFLDAVGTIFMASFAYGPACAEGFDFALSIAEEAMTAAEQDAAADARTAQEEACHE